MRLALLIGAAILGACSRGGPADLAMTNDSPDLYPEPAAWPVDPVGIRPIPLIPAALHGCWDSVPPDDPEEPYGQTRFVIDGRTITASSDGVGTRIASADFVEKVTPTMIEGRFSAAEADNRITVATSLILGPDARLGIPAGTLRLAEGDAGSYRLERCR